MRDALSRPFNTENMKKNLSKITLFIAFFIAVVMLAACSTDVSALDPEDTELRIIEIESGSSATSIGEKLEAEGIIASAKDFKIFAKNEGYDVRFQAGTYSLSPAMSLADVCEILVGGKTASVSFTVPEGLTIEQTAKKLAAQNLGTYEEFIEAIENDDYEYEFLDDAESLEGYLMPNTYSVPVNSSPHEIIDIMLRQFDIDAYSLIKEELKKNDSAASAYGTKGIVTIASIIERECKVDSERPLVSSVIKNRLNIGMNLGMCSTVQYLLLKETGEVKEVLLYSDLEIESPYNTYKHTGLPPGAIASAGMASIKAALNPADTDYLYFVLSEKLDGTSNFSADYNKFLMDKAAYDRAAKAS